MKTIQISDLTLRLNAARENDVSGFREKVESIKELDRLCVDVIETTCRAAQKSDALLLRTAAPLLKHSILSVACDELTEESIDAAWNAVKTAARPRLLLSVPTSSVQMEYLCSCKPKVFFPDRLRMPGFVPTNTQTDSFRPAGKVFTADVFYLVFLSYKQLST